MNSILFITALQSEAQPLIEFYRLEKKQINEKLFYYKKGSIYCLTTGVGERNVNKRLPDFLFNVSKNNMILINVGIAGGKRDITEKGAMYLISKIIDGNNGSARSTDIRLNSGLAELPLTTVSKGIDDGGKDFNGLVDMEAAAIFDIATRSSYIREMVFLKIVSDYMDKVLDSPEQVYPFIIKQLPEIDRIISQLKNRKNY